VFGWSACGLIGDLTGLGAGGFWLVLFLTVFSLGHLLGVPLKIGQDMLRHIPKSPFSQEGGAQQVFVGEFDPGSGRTLAACFTHASRTERPACGYSSGERVSNTWVTCPHLWDNRWKRRLIPDTTLIRMVRGGKFLRLGRDPRPISLLVR
jgi:hypothetical protein